MELPGGDSPAFVLRTTAFAGWRVHVRITVYAPAAEVLGRINPAVGVVEAIDDNTCVLVTGADSVETVAVYIGMLGLDFAVNRACRAARTSGDTGQALRQRCPAGVVGRPRRLGHLRVRRIHAPSKEPSWSRRRSRWQTPPKPLAMPQSSTGWTTSPSLALTQLEPKPTCMSPHWALVSVITRLTWWVVPLASVSQRRGAADEDSVALRGDRAGRAGYGDPRSLLQPFLIHLVAR